MTQLVPPQEQLKLLRELYKMENSIPHIGKTVILYDFYDNRTDDEHKLANLHACGLAILDKTIKVEVQSEQCGNMIISKYRVSEEQLKEKNIIRTPFQVQNRDQKGEITLDNIFVYESEALNVRVVVIPLQAKFNDVAALWKESNKDEEENKNKDQQFRDRGLTGNEQIQARKQWKEQIKKRFDKRCIVAAEKHLKMFKLEAFLSTILAKTQLVSISSLVSIGVRYKTLGEYAQEFKELFSVPLNFKPQYIFHGFHPKDTIAVRESKSVEIQVTTIFSLDKGAFGVVKYDPLNEQYFFPTTNIRTEIYKNMQNHNNAAIIHVIQEFVNGWNQITLDSAQSFATVLNLIYSSMEKPAQKGEQDLNASVQSVSSKDIGLGCLSFKQIFAKYITDEPLALKEQVKIEPFYTVERMKKIKPEEGLAFVPEEIENIVFYHFFCKIVKDFTGNYHQREIETKNNQLELLKLWREVLRQIYELIDAINPTFLSKSENLEYKCQDMQTFFNFVTFAFHSMEKVKNITGRDLPTASSLNAFFEKLKPRQEKLLSYIIANQDKIKAEQPIHYYDLYLLVISQNSSKDMQKDMKYIYLHIHELKAYSIAKLFIYDNEKVVEAIKSYALIALKYKELNEKQKGLINIVQIESRMARLLKIIGQEEFAANIYLKKRETEYADKCYKQILSKLKGDSNDKAQNLIRWGEFFEKEYEYDLAQSYYRKAFSFAIEVPIKQEAKKHTFACNERIRKELVDTEFLSHENFLKDGDLIKYTSEIDLSKLYADIKSKLFWDKDSKTSIMLDAPLNSEDSETSFFSNVEDGQATSASTLPA